MDESEKEALLRRISAMVREDGEGPIIRTLDPQVRTTKYAGGGPVKDISAEQNDGTLLDVKSLDDFKGQRHQP